MQEICSCKKKPYPDPRDYQFSDLMKTLPAPFTFPIHFSLRDKFPQVYDQGQHGTCTSCAALGCDAYYNHRGKPGWMPSILFTYYNQKAPDDLKEDNGDTVENALKKVRKYGVCKERIWPYTEPWNQKPSKEAYEDGLKGHEITFFYQINNLIELRKAISQGYPCPGVLNWKFDTIDSDNILHLPEKYNKDWNGHGIIFIGYDDERQLLEIRNSWSALWGDNGYGFVRYADAYKLIDFSDTYAVRG